MIEYAGEVIPWEEAVRRHSAPAGARAHTMLFELDGGEVIDGSVGGNSSRWINHSCDPNCDTEDDGGRIWVLARRDIAAGEELTFDYRLEAADDEDDPHGRYACACGTPACRGTMLER